MNLESKSGPYEIFKTGSVIEPPGNPVEFIFDKSEPPMTYRFLFKSDEKGGVPRTGFKKISKTEIELYFYNFDNGLDNCGDEPFHLGSLNGRLLYLHYKIDSFADVPEKIIHYTWYLGDPTQ